MPPWAPASLCDTKFVHPVVFLGTFVSVIAQSLDKQLGLDYPDEDSVHARRSGDASSSFCMEPYRSPALEQTCREYHEKLLSYPCLRCISKLPCIRVYFLLLGKLKVTRYVSLVPTSVMEASLSCVGYKVFSFALKFSITRLARSSLLLPTLPLAAFHIYVIVWGSGLEQARAEDMTFPESRTQVSTPLDRRPVQSRSHQHPGFGQDSGFDDHGHPCALDCRLKISATESKLPGQYDRERETVVVGIANALR